MGTYNKAIAAIVMAIATMVADRYGTAWGLPLDWPVTVTAVLTPILVWLIPNKE